MAAPMLVIELVLMRSMYPNRALSRALMAADGELQKLCGQIIESQQREIDQMKQLLTRLVQPKGTP